MTGLTKFYQFSKDVMGGVHNFDTHTFKVMLTNTAPVLTNTIKANITEITTGHGYSAGGTASTVTTSTSTGIAKATFADVTFTASGGSIGPFRYVVVYNDTPTSPADPLIGYIDYGASVSIANGDLFPVDFDGTLGTILMQ